MIVVVRQPEPGETEHWVGIILKERNKTWHQFNRMDAKTAAKIMMEAHLRSGVIERHEDAVSQ